MREKKRISKKIVSLVLTICMFVSMLPLAVSAEASTDTVNATLTEAESYITSIMNKNNPSEVVLNYGKHFTWDNEKRENDESYLYDWSYYNGVVFEGLEYVYEVTDDETYKDYVIEYMSSMINADGTWATCSNNSSKECAGYVDTHGADCYKTASLLLDTYEMTNDNRYLTMAKTLYADLDEAAEKYLLNNAGNNYRHTWKSDSDPDLWLDGLYMILPFRAEYAKYSGDTEELDLIVDRLQWVSEYMYDEETGYFYHAADSASSNSGTFWLRSIGWYAAAMVDVMDSMSGDNLEIMKAQLKKLADGMKNTQNSSNGMWLNNLAAGQSSSNPYETSGTALVCYAIMKAVNEGWLDKSYADIATLAFEGICSEKLENNILTDICFKGTPGNSNSTFYDDEGKGVGPFIMLYAEVMEYQKKQSGETPADQEVTVDDTVIKVSNVIGNLTAATVTAEDKVLVEEKNYDNFIVYDLSAELVEGEKATVSIPVPTEWNATEDQLIGISVEDGVLKEIKGTLNEGVYSFEVEHFSAKGVALTDSGDATNTVSGTGNLVGGNTYTLDTDGVDYGKDNRYLIVGQSNDVAMYDNGSGNEAGVANVAISNNIITLDHANYEWYFDQSGNNIYITHDGTNRLYHYYYQMYTNSSNNQTWTVEARSNYGGQYRLTGYENSNWRLYYSSSDGDFRVRTDSSTYVRLFKLTSSSAGEEVVFTITSNSTTISPETVADLTGTVTVAGETVNLNECTITWESSNDSVATISDGTVTGVADGTTNVTATLSAVNGTTLQEDIVLTIPVTVQSKAITSATLTGNNPVTTKQNVEPDFSNIRLEVIYEDDTTGIITVDNGLVIAGYDITTIGYSYATISYAGEEYGTVRVTVEGNPYEGLEEATEYPEYPADGAVRIDKTATEQDFSNTGVVKVELDVAGITVKRGVDVVLVADISNSMAWKSGEKNVSPGAGETTKWQDLQSAAGTFIDVLLKDNEAGETANTVSFVTFGGYDAQRNDNADNYRGFFDATQTVYTSSSDASAAKAAINAYSITGNDTDGYTVTINGNSAGTPQGGTNYDYAFLEAASAIEQIKSEYASVNNGSSYDDSGREIYVVFMTDGAPDHYNQLYYKSRSSSQFDYYALYRNSSDTLKVNYFTAQGTLPTYNTFTQNVTDGYYMPSSGTVSNDNWISWIQSDSLYAAEQVAAIENVNSITAVGFDLANGAFSTYTFGETVLQPVLENLAGENSCDVLLTSDADELNSFYQKLATKIKYAGTNANVSDIVDSEFTLQTTAFGTEASTAATIDIIAYDLWTKAETNDKDLIGTRKDNTYTVLETVTFNADGTEAYSSEKEGNILSTSTDGTVTIDGFYFDYVKTPEGIETFKWEIGNITDKEVALSYYAYLEGSLEGTREKGLYYTNEEATLEYVDINDKHAEKIFPIPAVNWGGASTAYEFYLVNANGEPVDRDGNVIPFANRIIVYGPEYQAINLNADLTVEATIKAKDVLPAGYYLYDENAYYTVQTRSGDALTGELIISEPSEDAAKEGQDGTAQTTIAVSFDEKNYTQSRVAFGVRYDLLAEYVASGLEGDKVVIDYGKDIQVDVLANDVAPVKKNDDGEVVNDYSEYTRTLVGFTAYNANAELTQVQKSAGEKTYTSSNGVYTIVSKDDTQVVNFKLTKMLSVVEKVFCVVEYTKDNDTIYLYEELDIIPATIVYYETDFADNIFNLTASDNEWVKATVTGDIVADGPQDDGTIGQNLYGFDTTYANDKYLSNGSSLKVIGQGVKVTKAEFAFTGTGFDVISRTGTEQGAIRVDIYSDAERTNRVKSITVLNKSETELELYQIPVVSATVDTYGTYYVTIGVNAAYTNDAYPDLSRGGEFYFDALRVYNPVSQNDTDINLVNSAYMADNEANMELKEVRNILIDDEASLDGTEEAVVFVDRNYNSDEEGNVADIGVGLAEYTTIGPNNEVYLVGSQAIGFGIKVDSSNLPTSIDIGAKSVHGETAYLKVAVYVGDKDTESILVEKEIASGTSQFFDILGGESLTSILDGETTLYVVIDNLGEGILSITDLKIAYGNGTSTAKIFADEIVLDKTIESVDNSSEEETMNYDVLSAEFTKTSIKRRSTATLIVTTPESVETLEVKNKAGRIEKVEVVSVETADGVKTWTVQYKITSTGTQSYTVTGYGADGSSGTSVTTTIKVTR